MANNMSKYSKWGGENRGGAHDKFGISDLGLSIRSYDGSIYLVDSNGKIIPGITNITVNSAVRELTTLNIEAFSFRFFDEGIE